MGWNYETDCQKVKDICNVLNRWTLSRVTMIHVLLDSNIYRQDPLRKSAAFQALARMGNAGELALHIPYFVKQEFLTHRREEYEKLLRDVKAGLAKLTKRPLSTRLTEAFEKHSDDIQLLSDDVLNSVNDEFDSWCPSVSIYLRHLPYVKLE